MSESFSFLISQAALYLSHCEPRPEPRPEHGGFCVAGKYRQDYLVYKSRCWVFGARKRSVTGPVMTRKSSQ